MKEEIGWTPVLGVEKVEGGFVYKVTDWLGSGCNKPPLNLYVAKNGYVNNKSQAEIITTIAQPQVYTKTDW